MPTITILERNGSQRAQVFYIRQDIEKAISIHGAAFDIEYQEATQINLIQQAALEMLNRIYQDQHGRIYPLVLKCWRYDQRCQHYVETKLQF